VAARLELDLARARLENWSRAIDRSRWRVALAGRILNHMAEVIPFPVEPEPPHWSAELAPLVALHEARELSAEELAEQERRQEEERKLAEIQRDFDERQRARVQELAEPLPAIGLVEGPRASDIKAAAIERRRHEEAASIAVGAVPVALIADRASRVLSMASSASSCRSRSNRCVQLFSGGIAIVNECRRLVVTANTSPLGAIRRQRTDAPTGVCLRHDRLGRT
jgi:hypothetical protein